MKRIIPLLIAAPLATSVSAQRPLASPPPPTTPTAAPRPPVEVSLDWYSIARMGASQIRGTQSTESKRGLNPGDGGGNAGSPSQQPRK